MGCVIAADTGCMSEISRQSKFAKNPLDADPNCGVCFGAGATYDPETVGAREGYVFATCECRAVRSVEGTVRPSMPPPQWLPAHVAGCGRCNFKGYTLHGWRREVLGEEGSFEVRDHHDTKPCECNPVGESFPSVGIGRPLASPNEMPTPHDLYCDYIWDPQ